MAQSKLIRCVRGSVFDIGVDIRVGSPYYGRWKGFELSASNGLQVYLPVGFAHGFLTLESNCEVVYHCSDYYSPECERSLRWDSCGIEWPFKDGLILNNRDAMAPVFGKFKSPFIYGKNS